MKASELKALWDFNDPAGSEGRFRKLLEDDAAQSQEMRAEVLTQIARAQGLQRKFDEANLTLDSAETCLANEPADRVRARICLERGRVLNTSGAPAEAMPWFERAWVFSARDGDAALQIDALHMLAIAAPPEEQLAWNERALALAETSQDPAARAWIAPLLNDIGWTLHDRGDFAEALVHFQRAVPLRRESGKTRETRIAEWSVARCLRSMGRSDDALAIQERLREEWEADGEPDPYVFEELGECLLLLNRASEARPHFAAAHAALSQDTWLTEHEPARIERLKRLSEPV